MKKKLVVASWVVFLIVAVLACLTRWVYKTSLIHYYVVFGFLLVDLLFDLVLVIILVVIATVRKKLTSKVVLHNIIVIPLKLLAVELLLLPFPTAGELWGRESVTIVSIAAIASLFVILRDRLFA